MACALSFFKVEFSRVLALRCAVKQVNAMVGPPRGEFINEPTPVTAAIAACANFG